jgi:hypothetical protein
MCLIYWTCPFKANGFNLVKGSAFHSRQLRSPFIRAFLNHLVNENILAQATTISICNTTEFLLTGEASWAEYGHLIDESRLVHVTTLDFLCLTAFAPFWMLNDAEARKWEQKCVAFPFSLFKPVVHSCSENLFMLARSVTLLLT